MCGSSYLYLVVIIRPSMFLPKKTCARKNNIVLAYSINEAIFETLILNTSQQLQQLWH